MIILDEALNIAKSFIQEVSKTDGDWQLEEATFDEKKRVWSVTYSFWRTSDIQNAFANESLSEKVGNLMKSRLNGRRVYRTVKVNAETADVIEMKAGFAERQPEAA